MAAPNIVNVATITGITTGRALTTALTTALVMNPASSGKAFKINSIIVANIDGTNTATATVYFFDNSQSARFKIAAAIPVPPGTSLNVLDKNSAIYLEEGDKIEGLASAASDLNMIVSYEEITD